MDNLQGKRILVIDDDLEFLDFVSLVLTRDGAQVSTATNGNEGLRQLKIEHPALVLLGIMMPGLPGFETCSRIIELSQTPVIFLTALARVNDIVNGLNLGAVDYVTKPFNPSELVARIRTALRQVNQMSIENPPTSYEDDYLSIDLDQRSILVARKPVHLTSTEYRLLTHLLTNANQVLTYADILGNVWGPEYRNSNNYVYIYVWRLRQKIERDPRKPRYLLSEPGIGYRFEKLLTV